MIFYYNRVQIIGALCERGKIFVDSAKRAAFFAQRTKVHAAFKRLPQNPLFIEETSLPAESKGPLGEYFIPPEEFAKLIAARIIKYDNRSSSGLHFDTKNIFIIDNNPNVLDKTLRESELLLKHNSGNLKIHYIDYLFCTSCELFDAEQTA
jgi:hypothetical protein